ncbi:hypothetical protein [Alkaliphilus sp. B6464]|uniref:hypothetical protein n=1 Tax=Alkaliphilus sp. B6464 TaxID=2731219 RepID=UPI001BA899FB|nr:hypothetical protein [Alkaliphilus sp. B6464]QUH21986.1 hypothetical protein HYG84_18955 [Alkaliphilus sp. B6464]
MSDVLLTFIVENTGYILQVFIYLFLGIYLLTILWPKKKASLDDLFNEETLILTKEDKKYMKLAQNKIIALLIPKPDSNSYKKTLVKFSKIGGYGKYKNLTIYYAKKAYFTFLAIAGVLIANMLPALLFQLQIYMEVENPQVIKLPIGFIIFTFIIPLILYIYPDLEINSAANKQETQLKKELISLGIFIHTMLETGNNAYDILTLVKEIKPVYREYIEAALNEYYVNVHSALTNLKDKVGIYEFDMIVDSLIFSCETDNNYASKFLGEYLDRLEETTKINDEKGNKLKPYILLVSAMPPLIAALLIWFYPWITQATSSLIKGVSGF